MISIENQIAVVTGAGRGIGRAIAIELGKLGARVVLIARSKSDLEETAQAIGPAASVMPADVRNKQQLHGVFEQTASALGPADILVNAAGLGIFGPVVADAVRLFPAPTLGTNGNLGRNTVRGPGFAQTDLQLAKTFRFTERINAKLQIDAFNAFNRVNLNNPSLDLTSNSFGRSTTARVARLFQAGLRIGF